MATAAAPPSIPDPARQLLGRTLDGGWTVVEKLEWPEAATGGNFSVGYFVERPDGKRAFLKALDFSDVMRRADAADWLRFLTEGYIFERDMLKECERRSMSRVVRVLAADTLVDPVFSHAVLYLILEPADGDIRRALDAMKHFDAAFALSAVHDAAVGLQQLHGADVAHQDVKPSNLLTFEEEAAAKLGDLGRCSRRGFSAPHDAFAVRGDPAYAPPELLYGHVDPEWSARCRACDIYLLGSLLLFVFTRTQTTAEVFRRLPGAFIPSSMHGPFSGDYADALPYVMNAFDEVADEFAAQLDGQREAELVEHFRALCHPDPAERGDSVQRRRGYNPYDVRRLISRLDVLRHDARGRYLNRKAK